MQNSDIPDIINTPIVPESNDAFWGDNDGLSKDLQPRPTLVITTVLDEKSEEKTLLEKILQACQLKENEYNILQLNIAENIAWHLLRDRLELKTVILFGIEPGQLGVSAQLMPHQTNRFNNCNWIVTSSLSQILKQPEIKNHLWNYGLKPVFIDKIYG